ncbi:MAG: TonB-dependent receptor plug domain-containing protein, partial [Hoylesella buccalis]
MIHLKREANLLTITSLVAFQSLAHMPAFANPGTRAMMVTDDDHANVHAEMVDTMRFNSPISLDEVVVTGQGGAIERRRLSSNVTKISGKDLQKLTVGRMDEMLRNAIPGVQFSLSGAQPGSTSVIKARGLSSAFSNSTPIIY